MAEDWAFRDLEAVVQGFRFRVVGPLKCVWVEISLGCRFWTARTIQWTWPLEGSECLILSLGPLRGQNI